MKEPALVLRATRYRDADLLVELFAAQSGRVTVMARGARKSARRFGGALELGTRLRVELRRGRGGRLSFASCDVERAPKAIRGDLDRINHLSFVLEVARLSVQPGEADPRGYALVCAYLDALEEGPAVFERLVSWELAMLRHLGYGLRFDACVVTGGAPEGMSLEAGGAVSRLARAPDQVPVPPAALRTLDAIARGEQPFFAAAHRAPVRRALDRVWEAICGRALRTSAWLLGLPG